MTDVTRRIRDLQLTFTTDQRKRYGRLAEEVSGVYDSGKLSDEQKLYLTERCVTELPVDVKDVLRLNLTKAAKDYLDPPPPRMKVKKA